jgi:hypothetical protein
VIYGRVEGAHFELVNALPRYDLRRTLVIAFGSLDRQTDCPHKTRRRQYAAGELNAAPSKKCGPKAAPAREELRLLAMMTRERDKMRVQLSNAQLVIEVQRKVAALLEQPC